MSNFLGKLKDIIGGGQQDYQYYEEEMETMATEDLPKENIIVDSAVESPPETSPPVQSSPSSRRRQREKSSLKMEMPSSSYMDNSMSSVLPNNVIGMPGVSNAVNEVVIIEPHSFDEIPQVIQTLREQRCVLLNLNVMEPDEAQRAVDFVAGGTYAIDGHQERIGESIFLFTPRNVKVSTVSGSTYQVREPVMSNTTISNSFSDPLWNDDTVGMTSNIAQ
ncbi:cell division protein SepF [Geminocystis herdmanii]|uniref:cell division protein SepF n=1 Tax=Geminocystis herdmanii TaxID=669359 RepID=UPI00034BCA21|nr:cell division protein SepF [Geminocystis herdmanii]